MTDFLLPPKLPSLEAALRDAAHGSPDARWVAALSLGRESGEGMPAALEALLGLSRDPCEEIRAQAVEGLLAQARQGAQIEETVVLEALGDQAPAVRCAALDAALVILKEPVPSVVMLADDPDISVRLAACRAMGDLLAEAGIEALKGRLSDPHRLVRLEAAVALARMDVPDGEAVLISALAWAPREARDAAKALALLGARNARPQLERMAARRFIPSEIKAMAAVALMRCTDNESGKATIARMLVTRSASQNLVALTTLAELPVIGVAGEVGALLRSRDPLVVSSAIRTLAALSTLDFAEAKRALQQHGAALQGRLADELEECLAAIRPPT
jgi:HEAT repeat protein